MWRFTGLGAAVVGLLVCYPSSVIATVTEYFIPADRVHLEFSHESVRSRSGTRGVPSSYWPASNQVWAEASKTVRLELLDEKGQVTIAINSLLTAESKSDLTAYSTREANFSEKEEASERLAALVKGMETTLRKAGKSRVVIVVNDTTVKLTTAEERKAK